VFAVKRVVLLSGMLAVGCTASQEGACFLKSQNLAAQMSSQSELVLVKEELVWIS
jgi:hypothetical protein